jgi:hypothetical protein
MSNLAFRERLLLLTSIRQCLVSHAFQVNKVVTRNRILLGRYPLLCGLRHFLISGLKLFGVVGNFTLRALRRYSTYLARAASRRVGSV